MIRFVCSMSDGDVQKSKKIILENAYTYLDILKINGEFQIVIHESIFFSEPNFPVLEFLKDALAWCDCSDESEDMIYSSVETEDNPLIAFIKKGDEWMIRSPWQAYECRNTFTKDEMTSAVLHLANALTTQGDGSVKAAD